MSDTTKVVGYFAFMEYQVLCDGDACIIAGSETALKQYIKDISGNETGFIIKKTRLGEVLEGISMGGAYAFDSEAYSRFKPLAKKHGLELKEPEFTEKYTFFTVKK